MTKASLLLEKLYHLNKMNQNDIEMQESPILIYVGSINVKSSDENTIHDAKLSEHDKARELLYAMYGIQ